jgi:uncharacterized membrane protein YdbT with pleckstrin-like domain
MTRCGSGRQQYEDTWFQVTRHAETAARSISDVDRPMTIELFGVAMIVTGILAVLLAFSPAVWQGLELSVQLQLRSIARWLINLVLLILAVLIVEWAHG